MNGTTYICGEKNLEQTQKKWKIRTESGKTKELMTEQQSEKSKFYLKVTDRQDKGVENWTALLYKERIHIGCSAKCRQIKWLQQISIKNYFHAMSTVHVKRRTG